MRRKPLPYILRWLAALCGVVWLFVPTPAFALLCGTFLNALTVSATAVNFGTYDAASASEDTANGTVTIRCALLGLDVLPNFTVALSTGASGTYTPRHMTMGGNNLNYNLYKTASSSGVVWGDGSGATGTNTYSTLLLLGTVDFTAYGFIPVNQYVPAGAYSDTITVTVTY